MDGDYKHDFEILEHFDFHMHIYVTGNTRRIRENQYLEALVCVVKDLFGWLSRALEKG